MRSAMERVRLRIAGHEFPRVTGLTVSAGFTRIGADDTPEAAFGRADKAVYAAKQAGRNCVVDACDLPETEELPGQAEDVGVEFF
jgi:PleD family two-component response regulator